MRGQHENTSRTVRRRVRRWRLLQRMLIAAAMLAGAVLIAAVLDPQGEVIPPLAWGPCVVIVCLCGYFAAIAGMYAREASFSRAHSNAGTVVEVIEVPASGDYGVSYLFTIEAELSDGTILHRQLDMGGWADAFSWMGRQVHFRHNTLAVDDLEDAFYGREEHLATRGRHRSREHDRSDLSGAMAMNEQVLPRPTITTRRIPPSDSRSDR